MLNDPYEALGLAKAATAGDIKKAYRKLARTSHPDLNPDDAGAEERFKTISAAYELLKNPETRKRYDAGEIDGLGAERPQRTYYRDFADAPDNTYQRGQGFAADADAAAIFEQILRNRGRHSGAEGFGERGFSASGADARYSLEVPFMDSVLGAETRITLPDGQSLAVKIPKGTEDRQTLRLRGKGASGFGGGPPGDALITIHLRPHRVFRREGDDILLTLPITIDEAVLGGRVTAPTIDGPVGLTVPPGSSSGRVLRLRGRGVTRAGQKTKGDQRVELKIVVGPDADPALNDFLVDWRKSQAFDPRADLLKGASS